MVVINRINLSLGEPLHGWLPFCFEFDGYRIEDTASKVLNNPLEELLSLLHFSLHPGMYNAIVYFWLEPAGYAIEVYENSRTPLLKIRVYFGKTFYPPNRTDAVKLEFEGEVHRNQLSTSLIEAFTRFFEGTSDLRLWGGEKLLERFRDLQQEHDQIRVKFS
jgi:hypothetical protein